jgi:hypothetical protein
VTGSSATSEGRIVWSLGEGGRGGAPELGWLWAGLFQIAGATTGLAALIYVGGTISMWLRLRIAGYPPDIGVEHQSRAAMAAIGFRGLLAVLGVLVILVVVLAVITFVFRVVEQRHPRFAALAFAALPSMAAAALLAGAVSSWQVFGVTLVFVTGLVVAGYYERLRASRLRWTAAVVAVALSALVAVVAWQVDRTARVQGVYIDPVPEEMKARSPTPDLLAEVAFPYFGTGGGFVYVGEVRSVVPLEGGDYQFNVCGEPAIIVEVPRSEVQLRFPPRLDELYAANEIATPVEWLWGHLTGRWPRDDPAGPSPTICSEMP